MMIKHSGLLYGHSVDVLVIVDPHGYDIPVMHLYRPCGTSPQPLTQLLQIKI